MSEPEHIKNIIPRVMDQLAKPRCKVCGIVLTHPKSIARGMGKKCAKKI